MATSDPLRPVVPPPTQLVRAALRGRRPGRGGRRGAGAGARGNVYDAAGPRINARPPSGRRRQGYLLAGQSSFAVRGSYVSASRL